MTDSKRSLLADLGLLILRIAAGLAMAGAHGWSKLSRFSELSERFADPLGVGTTTSLALAVFAEVGCSVLLVLGLGTRLAALPLAFTMAIAAFVIHADDPWNRKELALAYLVVYVALALTGAGRFSLDAKLWRGKLAWLR
ncbi:MAG: DoxX family protein [Sandaracinus sp.]|nr:DoxX family protein [Sandaracinus sp.]MCB9631053.1 DoxX family protein [Sandaracinus sp.]